MMRRLSQVVSVSDEPAKGVTIASDDLSCEQWPTDAIVVTESEAVDGPVEFDG